MLCGPAPCDGGTTTLIKEATGCLFGFKLNETVTVEAVAKFEKRGEENREKEKKKRQQSSLRSFFDFQFVHRWIGLRF